MNHPLLTVAVGAHYPLDQMGLAELIAGLPGLRVIPLEAEPPPQVLVWDLGLRESVNLAPESGWRWSLVQSFDCLLRWGQRKANRPEAIHGLMFGAFCHTVCRLIETTWTMEERMAWETQNRAIADNILQSRQRDPGRRILVAVQCQRLHRLIPLLRVHADVLEIVNYQEL